MAWPPEFLDLAHLGRGTLATAWELCLFAPPVLQYEAPDHLVAAEPVDNQRGSRSRNQPAKATRSGCCPWDVHHWNWSCGFEGVVGHRDRVRERWVDWKPMLERPSLSC